MNLAAVLLETLRLNGSAQLDEIRTSWQTVPLSGLAPLMQYEGGELWLYRRWQQIGLTRDQVRDPSCWDAIESAARRAGAQNLLVRSHGEAVMSLLRHNAIPGVFIKGVARQYLTDLFPFADARATNDVDLLIPRSHQQRAWDCLRAAGYQAQLGNTPEGHYHLPPLVDRAGVPVELHTSTTSSLDADEAWSRLAWSPPFVSGVHANPQTMATELLWHSLTHAFTHGIPAFRFRFFVDAASVLAGTSAIDWSIIDRRLNSSEVLNRWRALTWLDVAAWLGGSKLPEDLQLPPAERFPLMRMTLWRLRVFNQALRSPAWRGKLLSEGTSAELGLPTTPGVPGSAWPLRVRRRTASVLARLAYRSWLRRYQRSLHGGLEIGQRENETTLRQSKRLDPLTRK